MNLHNKTNQNNIKNKLLSATLPQENTLKNNTENKTMLQTRLKQRKIIKVYIEENKYYLEHSAAYALGLINTRAIMLDKPKMIELPDSIHNKLKNQDDIDIEYIKIEKKPKLKVYVNDSNYCIDNAAAYALGMLSTEQFCSLESEYYYINKDFLDNLMNQYEVEFYSLNLHIESSKKR